MNLNYRKKPIIIQAFQMNKERREDPRTWPYWLHEAWNKPWHKSGSLDPLANHGSSDRRLTIRTLESGSGFFQNDSLVIEWNDWIIKGVQGELYPCKPDIFAATYEPEIPLDR